MKPLDESTVCNLPYKLHSNKLLITSLNISTLNIKHPKPLATMKRVINSANRLNLEVYKNQLHHYTYQQNMLRLRTCKNRPNNQNHELTTLLGPCSGKVQFSVMW